MKHIRFALPILFSVLAASALADDCQVTIDSTDTMRFDKEEIVVNKTCKEFTVNLTHSGKLAKNVMGHNWVLTTAADMQAVATEGMKAGLENNYVKAEDARVIAATDIIGGGEKTSVTFTVSELAADQSYVFFCSFPGHWSIMKGTLALK
jgi:azurin